jgi:hypothetical protein
LIGQQNLSPLGLLLGRCKLIESPGGKNQTTRGEKNISRLLSDRLINLDYGRSAAWICFGKL